MSQDKKIEINGNSNTVAGNNVVYNYGEELHEKITKRLSEIDKEINDIIPFKILAPTRNNNLEEFSSEILFSSLSRIGVSIVAAFIVIETVGEHLKKLSQENNKLSTSHVRSAVASTINNLDPIRFSPSNIQKWSDRYIRRYGAPDTRIKVLNINGDDENFDYNFIQKIIIPHIIKRTLNVNYENVKDEFIKSQNISAMCEEIFDAVRSLNLYFIPYKTVLYIAESLALQPPHPWFVSPTTQHGIVEYDIDRARDHAKLMIEALNMESPHQSIHSCIECISHSCSAILAYYGSFIGAKHLAPLSSLLNMIDLCEEQKNVTLWENCSIKQIIGDLQSIGYSISDTKRLLLKIHKSMSYNLNHEKIKSLTKSVIELNNISESLIQKRKEIDRYKNKINEDLSKIENDEFRYLTFKFMQFLPNCRIQDVESEKRIRWLIHDLNYGVFRDIKSHILIFPCPNSYHVTHDDFEDKIILITEILEQKSQLSNSVIFVVRDQSINYFKDKITPMKPNEVIFVFAKMRDILDIYNSKDRKATFEKLF